MKILLTNQHLFRPGGSETACYTLAIELISKGHEVHVYTPNKGMVFADGSGALNWKWAAVLAVKMDSEEKEKFKEKGKNYDFKMDMTTIKHFDERDYIEALDYIKAFEE